MWARALGKPGGSSSTTTCATDPTDSAQVCSIGQFVSMQMRKSASPASAMSVPTCCSSPPVSTGKSVSTPIFSPNYQNYFWEYDNQGLKLLQLRFYQVPSNVPTSITC